MSTPDLVITQEMVDRWAWLESAKPPFYVSPHERLPFCIFRVGEAWVRFQVFRHDSQVLVSHGEWKLFRYVHRGAGPCHVNQSSPWKAMWFRGLVRALCKDLGVTRAEVRAAFEQGTYGVRATEWEQARIEAETISRKVEAEIQAWERRYGRR